MSNFCKRALAMLLTAAVFMIVIPIAIKLLVSVGPIGFVLLLFVLLALGAVLFD
jgi:hypothetical protein